MFDISDFLIDSLGGFNTDPTIQSLFWINLVGFVSSHLRFPLYDFREIN